MGRDISGDINVLVCFLCLIVGVMFTWPSSTANLFTSHNTTLHRPMTEMELALFSSLSSIGALVSTPVAGYCLDRIGRKYLLILNSLTHVISWTMIVSSNNVAVLLTAVFVSGIGGSVFMVVPVFISEICQESIRGTMVSGTMIFYALGSLVSYLLGGYLEYHTMTYVCLSLSVLGVAGLSLIKESPICLMQKGLEEEAAKIIAFYRSTHTKSKEVLHELDLMRRTLNPDMDDDLGDEEKELKPKAKTAQKLSTWTFIKKSRSTQRALVLALLLCTASIFQGIVIVQVYAEPIFKETVPNMPSTVCSVMFALVTVVAGVLAGYLTDLAGRRPLMIYSSISAGVCCVVLGAQIQLKWGPPELTAGLIYVFNITYTFGGGTIPYVLFSELFLPEIKSFLSMLIIEWVWLCNFIVLFVFVPIEAAIGLGPVFYIFSATCLATAVYSIIYLPETKGLPVDAIQLLFTKKRRSESRLH